MVGHCSQESRTCKRVQRPFQEVEAVYVEEWRLGRRWELFAPYCTRRLSLQVRVILQMRQMAVKAVVEAGGLWEPMFFGRYSMLLGVRMGWVNRIQTRWWATSRYTHVDLKATFERVQDKDGMEVSAIERLQSRKIDDVDMRIAGLVEWPLQLVRRAGETAG